MNTQKLERPSPPCEWAREWDRDDRPFTADEISLADVASFLRSRRNQDGSITLTPAEATRLAGLLGHAI